MRILMEKKEEVSRWDLISLSDFYLAGEDEAPSKGSLLTRIKRFIYVGRT